MSWLHHLTGFQLWIVQWVLTFAAYEFRRRWKAEGKKADLASNVIFNVEALIVWGYWLVVAVWPVASP